MCGAPGIQWNGSNTPPSVRDIFGDPELVDYTRRRRGRHSFPSVALPPHIYTLSQPIASLPRSCLSLRHTRAELGRVAPIFLHPRPLHLSPLFCGHESGRPGGCDPGNFESAFKALSVVTSTFLTKATSGSADLTRNATQTILHLYI